MSKKSWILLCLLVLFLMSSPLMALPARININSADVETLTNQLKGIGPDKAAAIVAYREENGPFREVEDIVLVKGIGWKTMEANRDAIRLRDDDELLTAEAEGKHSGMGKEASATSDNRKKRDPN